MNTSTPLGFLSVSNETKTTRVFAAWGMSISGAQEKSGCVVSHSLAG